MTDSKQSDGGVATADGRLLGLPRWVVGMLPLVLLAVLVGAFVLTTPLAGLDSGGEPLPAVSIDYTTIPHDHALRLHVTNNGPPTTIQQVHVDDANWQFTVTSQGEDAHLGTRESATIDIPYHWTPGYDYHVTILTEDGATFGTTIVAAHQTPGFNPTVMWTLTVMGLLVGVVPVALGMLWFPYMQTMSDRMLHGVLAFSAGILAFLVFDAGFEAFEIASDVPSSYEGTILVVLGIFGAFLVVQAFMDWHGGDEGAPLALAYAAALGIGLHNLAEGLAIGGAFALGRASLGAFLIVGFMIHNVTEGPVIVAPLARNKRPALGHFVAIGALAGAPAILGGWIGTLFHSPLLAALFLAIGVGALIQVIFDIGGLVQRKGTLMSATNLSGFFVGLLVMYATDLLITL